MFNFWYPHIRLCAVNNSVKVDYFWSFLWNQAKQHLQWSYEKYTERTGDDLFLAKIVRSCSLSMSGDYTDLNAKGVRICFQHMTLTHP